MTISDALLKVRDEADELSPEEQLQLIAYLAGKLQLERRAAPSDVPHTPERPRASWLDLAGAVPYPFLGEDAQQWVSRTRAEGDELRRISLNLRHERREDR
jgi:hypothetical protein